MRNTVFYPALSAVLSGVILLMFGFFFGRDPIDLTQNVSIRWTAVDVAAGVLQDLQKTMQPSLNFDDLKTSAKFHEEFGYSDHPSLSIFEIENHGDQRIPDLKVALSKYHHGYIQGNNTLTIIGPKETEVDIPMLPRTTAKLLLFTDYSLSEPSERFMIDGKEVNVISAKPQFGVELSEILSAGAGWIVVVLILIGLLTVFLLVMGAILTALIWNNAEYQVKNSSDLTLYRSLTVLNLIRQDAPQRFDSIVRKSEDLFGKWRKREAKEPSEPK